jgi:putative tricarboxylic transport membrane protein
MKILIGEVLVILAIGFLSVFDGIRLVRAKELQTLDALGPGYYNVGVGALLIIIGVVYFLIERKTVAEHVAAEATAEPAGADYKKTMIAMLAAMAGYIVLIDYAGYLVSTTVFFLFINRIVGFKSWLANLGASALMTATFYVVFITWLGIVFPRGSLFDLF